MSSLLALLSQKSTGLQTRRGLILTGLQQDFVSPNGKLPVTFDAGYFDRLDRLVTEFRNHGSVIWVRTEFENTRHPSEMDDEGCNVVTLSAASPRCDSLAEARSSPERSKSSKKRKAEADCSKCGADASSSSRRPTGKPRRPSASGDEELFLTRTSRREPACLRGSFGADYAKRVRPLIKPDRDMQIVKSFYSAFNSTSLLSSLRSKLITELYIAGCITNLSVYATAMDAARYGIKVILVEDCLGYRIRERHDLAVSRLVKVMEAKVLHSTAVIGRLRNPLQCVSDEESESEDDESEADVDDEEEDTSDAKLSNLLEADSDEEDAVDDDLPSVCYCSSPSIALELSMDMKTRKDLQGVDTGNAKNSVTDFGHSASSATKAAAVPDTQPDKSVQASCREENAELREDEVAASGEDIPSAGQQRIDPAHCAEPDADFSSAVVGNGDATRASGSGQDTHETHKYSLNTTQTRPLSPAPSSSSTYPLLRQDNHLASAGSSITQQLLPTPLASSVFPALMSEVNFRPLYHQASPVPRLVCCQATVQEDGTQPIYRHPSDATLLSTTWTPTVDTVRLAAQELCGHELNHCLIQHYRDRKDEIHEHSDKTLDIVPDTFVVNVSFGAERVMRLRSKRSSVTPGAERKIVKVQLEHNSAVLMSLQTNAEWLHGIKADKRREAEFSDAEGAYGGQRISLTFRKIGSWISGDGERIWGQGAKGRTREKAGRTSRGDAEESERLLKGFGRENAESIRDWEEWYGNGSDVLDLSVTRGNLGS
ncbi:hypothetical protein B0A48_17211 [Cryoendolithus antarcticus]|uniref:Fe2OG dioxygenase domain-containing protein n=1 Tax=Cryoendolithus antarcticus TaxID=1507870 RepID=A0A1V8SD90_9PEZI|nr:hypothetical protein B0A48_17211 [Cryoendolithus antarcticus]